MMLRLLDLPHEILRYILSLTDPLVWLSLSCTCRLLGELVHRDPLLYKQYYLQTWDPPAHAMVMTSNDWRFDVQKYIKLHKILQSEDEYVKKDYFDFVVSCIIELLGNGVGRSKNRELLKQYFLDERNRQVFLCHSSVFIRARREYPELWSFERRQISAKLHCLYGQIIPEASNGLAMYPFAADRVYDLRNYTAQTLWGPFRFDGSRKVDWEMVEAVMLVLIRNLRSSRVFTHRFIQSVWDRPFIGIWNAELDDIYGVNGTWMRLVCMLDYDDLTAFNAAPEKGFPATANEVMRLIVERMWITSIEAPGPDDDGAWPVVHFYGSSSPQHADLDPTATSYANVKGYVRMTKEGEVHWTTMVMFQGQERFRTEAIQVGGLRSAQGVVGCWFDKDYRPGGPAGPTSFWKISNEFDIDDSDVDKN